MCVEVRLDIPAVGRVWLRDHWYRVAYEGLHLLCNKCGCFGHIGRNCNHPPELLVVETKEVKEVTVEKQHAEGDTAPNPKPTKEGDQNQRGENLYGDWISVTKIKNNRNLSNDNEVEVLEIMVGGRIPGNKDLLQILSRF